MLQIVIAICVLLILLLVYIMWPIGEHLTVQQISGPWTTSLVKNNPTWLFLFEDNDMHTNQYDNIRYMPNAKGIPTGKSPSVKYTDKDLDANRSKVSAAVNDIFNDYAKYDQIVLPRHAIGSSLASVAPITSEYIRFRLDNLIQYLND